MTKRQQIAAAPKFTLVAEISGVKFYPAENQPMRGLELTDNKAEAIVFAEGFDNPQIKLSYYTTMLKMYCNKELAFSIEKL